MPRLDDAAKIQPAGPWRTQRWRFLAAVAFSFVAWLPASAMTYVLAIVIVPLALLAHVVLFWCGTVRTPSASLAASARRAATGLLCGGIVILVLLLVVSASGAGVKGDEEFALIVFAALVLVVLDFWILVQVPAPAAHRGSARRR
jgi:hypothetical protein